MTANTPATPADGFLTFRVSLGKINSIQEASMRRVIERCRHAHYTNIELRINGKDERHEADWIKHLEEVR